MWIDVDVAVRSNEGDERGEGVGREDPSGLAEVEEELRDVKALARTRGRHKCRDKAA